jgi:uncharacterized protein YegP (UPF0339 family)
MPVRLVVAALVRDAAEPSPSWTTEARSPTVDASCSYRQGRIVMAGKFELYKDKSGKFRFRLKASNGQVIATGEAYETKASALNGIESVKKNSADAATDDQTT